MCKIFSSLGLEVSTFRLYLLTQNAIWSEDSQIRTIYGLSDAVVVLVIAVLYHLRDELDCQYNANNTGDDTLYFPDKRGELLGSGRN